MNEEEVDPTSPHKIDTPRQIEESQPRLDPNELTFTQKPEDLSSHDEIMKKEVEVDSPDSPPQMIAPESITMTNFGVNPEEIVETEITIEQANMRDTLTKIMESDLNLQISNHPDQESSPKS